jgi:Domain of unknown function (DUF1942)
MNVFTKSMTGLGTVAVAAAIGFAGSGLAAAAPVTGSLGTPEQLIDANGGVVSSYTVTNLQPSNDRVDVPLAGRLYEATVTVNADRGSVTPAIPFFNARSADGQNYRVLFQAPAPEGINAATLNQGGSSTGKIYFDVTGPAPTQVVYNDAVQDRLVWNT